MIAVLLALLLATPPHPAALPSPAPPPLSLPASSAPVSEGKRAGDWPSQPSGKLVTVEDSITLDDALQQIAGAAGWSLVARTGRLGEREVVVHLRGTPVEEALAAVLEGT